MNYKELDSYLNSNKTSSNNSSEEILDHFRKSSHYTEVPYKDETMFVYNAEREFNKKNHIVALHPRNNGFVPMHIYHYVVITYVYSGVMHLRVQDTYQTLQEGDIVILDKHVPHSVVPTGTHDMAINIILNDEFFAYSFNNHLPTKHILARFLYELSNRLQTHTHYLYYKPGQDELIRNTINNILCEHLDPHELSDQIIDNYISILLTHLARFDPYQDNLNKQSKNHELLIHIAEYINEHYRIGNLNDACLNLGYSPAYASKIIKRNMGRTFKELINEERMRRAMILLKNKDMPIYEIAEEIGITNITAFYKRFKEYTNLTPQEYRDENS